MKSKLSPLLSGRLSPSEVDHRVLKRTVTLTGRRKFTKYTVANPCQISAGLSISFAVTKMLSLLAYPVSQVFLLLLCALVGLLADRRRGATLFLLAGLTWFYLSSTPALGSWLMAHLEAPYPPVAARDLPQVDAIVLLGGGVHVRKAEDVLGDLNLFSDRLVFAASLYREGKAPVIVISGGGPDGRPTEAELTREILLVMGVPDSAMVLEQSSRDTHDNSRYVVPLLRERGWNQVLMVTSAFHMRRATAAFSARGMAVIPAPTDHQITASPLAGIDWLPGLSGLTFTHYAIHEMVGYTVYRLRGWL